MIWLRFVMSVVLPVGLAACHVPDESRADDTWRPKGLNAANLAAMVENPADLVRGRGDAGPDRKLAAQAVIELWSNPSAALPQGDAAPGSAVPSVGTAPPGGAASANGASANGASGSGSSGSQSSGSGASGTESSGGGTQAGAAD